MYKLVVFALFVSAVSAGYLGAPAVATYAAAPLVHAGPAVVRAGPVFAAPAVAPVLAPAPLAYAAPAVLKAPVLAAPVAYGAHTFIH